jgi:hypothetical protein
MGVWLMPQPEAYVDCTLEVYKRFLTPPYKRGNSGFVVGDDLGMRQSEDARS